MRWYATATDSIAAQELLSELEGRVLSEKAKGVSDLELASKLLLYESTVRAIVRKHKVGSQNVSLRPGKHLP
jgi:DNA-binding NarL/FixJ family response regulator